MTNPGRLKISRIADRVERCRRALENLMIDEADMSPDSEPSEGLAAVVDTLMDAVSALRDMGG